MIDIPGRKIGEFLAEGHELPLSLAGRLRSLELTVLSDWEPELSRNLDEAIRTSAINLGLTIGAKHTAFIVMALYTDKASPLNLRMGNSSSLFQK